MVIMTKLEGEEKIAGSRLIIQVQLVNLMISILNKVDKFDREFAFLLKYGQST